MSPPTADTAKEACRPAVTRTARIPARLSRPWRVGLPHAGLGLPAGTRASSAPRLSHSGPVGGAGEASPMLLPPLEPAGRPVSSGHAGSAHAHTSPSSSTKSAWLRAADRDTMRAWRAAEAAPPLSTSAPPPMPPPPLGVPDKKAPLPPPPLPACCQTSSRSLSLSLSRLRDRPIDAASAPEAPFFFSFFLSFSFSLPVLLPAPPAPLARPSSPMLLARMLKPAPANAVAAAACDTEDAPLAGPPPLPLPLGCWYPSAIHSAASMKAAIASRVPAAARSKGRRTHSGDPRPAAATSPPALRASV